MYEAKRFYAMSVLLMCEGKKYLYLKTKKLISNLGYVEKKL